MDRSSRKILRPVAADRRAGLGGKVGMLNLARGSPLVQPPICTDPTVFAPISTVTMAFNYFMFAWVHLWQIPEFLVMLKAPLSDSFDRSGKRAGSVQRRRPSGGPFLRQMPRRTLGNTGRRTEVGCIDRGRDGQKIRGCGLDARRGGVLGAAAWGRSAQALAACEVLDGVEDPI